MLWRTARKAGLDDAGILAATEIVAYFNFVNRLAHGLGSSSSRYEGLVAAGARDCQPRRAPQPRRGGRRAGSALLHRLLYAAPHVGDAHHGCSSICAFRFMKNGSAIDGTSAFDFMSKKKKAVRWPFSVPKYAPSGLYLSADAPMVFGSEPSLIALLPGPTGIETCSRSSAALQQRRQLRQIAHLQVVHLQVVRPRARVRAAHEHAGESERLRGAVVVVRVG